MKKVGIDPAPRRSGQVWPLFLRSQAEAILACDFFAASLLDGTQAYVVAVIEHVAEKPHWADSQASISPLLGR